MLSQALKLQEREICTNLNLELPLLPWRIQPLLYLRTKPTKSEFAIETRSLQNQITMREYQSCCNPSTGEFGRTQNTKKTEYIYLVSHTVINPIAHQSPSYQSQNACSGIEATRRKLQLENIQLKP